MMVWKMYLLSNLFRVSMLNIAGVYGNVSPLEKGIHGGQYAFDWRESVGNQENLALLKVLGKKSP